MTVRELLAFNLLLQLFDGAASYFILLSSGGSELNPLVSGAIDAWGLGWGLFYCKLACSVMLLALHSFKRFRPTLTIRGLRFVAMMYSALGFALAVQLFQSV